MATRASRDGRAKADARRRAAKQRLRRKRMRKLALPAVFGVALAAALVAVSLQGGPSSGPAHAAPPPSMGADDAPVVLQEWGDFQCSACGAFARLVAPEIRRDYVETGRVRIEWHDYAWYGQESFHAANAARCAGDDDRYWEYHDMLFDRQQAPNTGNLTPGRLKEYARGIAGIDLDAFDACVDAGTHLPAVRADVERSRELGLRGTPAFFLNGTPLPLSSAAGFRAALDEALG